MRKHKSIVLALAIVLAIATAVSGATFAWYTSNDAVLNKLSTSILTDGNVSIREDFTPPEEWKPGDFVTKKVGAVNVGDSPAVVRISFEEMLSRLLDANVSTTTDATPPTDTVNTPVLWTAVEQLSNPVGFTSNGYTLLDAATHIGTGKEFGSLTTTPATLPADLQIYWKKDTSGSEVAYSFIMFRALATAPVTYQRITADIVVSYTVDNLGVRSQPALTLNNIKYYWFHAAAQKKLNYAAFQTDKAFSNALYTGTYAGGWTQAKPAAADFVLNTVAGPAGAVGSHYTLVAKTDASLGGNDLILHFTAGLVIGDGTAPATSPASEWYYNPADGFFYYIGQLTSGRITKDLLAYIELNESAGDEYGNMNFDLNVVMEAIQATETALVSNTGWNLNASTDPNSIVLGLFAPFVTAA